ncbi:MAG TPA: FAD-dependent oxidoreductase [candidate division Zixibacteria bacterium]|nr:FAD-dependent oxidoreductase [candidate division Zixibacteria bacterium]
MIELNTVVIVGGGLAGASAAFELRAQGYGGRLVVVSEEGLPPYERPPLSKAYLRGEEPLEKAFVRPLADYEAQGIQLLRGRRAVTLDPSSRLLNLDDGTNLTYDALLIATGARPRRLTATNAHLPGLAYLRTAADADALRAAAAEARETVVIGGGWIGSEVAASLRQLGHAVTLVSNLPRPLERVLGPEVADVYRTLHLEHGVRLVHGRVSRIEGTERADGVALSDGRRIGAELVVVGAGATPRLELATRAGLVTTDGAIAVDEYLRTSVPSIYAAGDVAAAWHPRFGRHLRVEHWDNAIHQGRTAAANILGRQQPYARIPYFFSDQYDLGMEYRGCAPQWERVVIRGDLTARAFHAFWLADGRVIAAMNANLWDDGEALLQLVESEQQVDPARLADPAVPLDGVLVTAA